MSFLDFTTGWPSRARLALPKGGDPVAAFVNLDGIPVGVMLPTNPGVHPIVASDWRKGECRIVEDGDALYLDWLCLVDSDYAERSEHPAHK